MHEPRRSFEHQDVEKKTDDALRQEARAHLADAPGLQLVAELHKKLRSLDLSWWTPEALRSRWSASDRMRWLRSRADLRQEITTKLSGLAPRAARKKTPEFQGALIDSAIDEGDVTVHAFEDAFDPADLAVYGPADDLWQAFVDRMPWGDAVPVHQELCAWLFEALLDGRGRKPILTAWEARTAIDGRVWHTRMPLEIRVAIDDARFDKERQRPNEPFHAQNDLSIAVAATIAASIPLEDLRPVFTAAQKKLGLGRPSRETIRPPPRAAAEPSVATPSVYTVDPPTQPQPAHSKAALKASTPPAAPAPVRASTPPPGPSRPPPAASPKRDAPTPSTGAKSGVTRSASAPIPEAFHHISGEEENTNPWDIPTEQTLPRASEKG
jgi:hypothetical protein